MCKRIFFVTGFFFALYLITNAQSQSGGSTSGRTYNPVYWTEGDASYLRNSNIDPVVHMKTMVDEIKGKGWNGILYWGASRVGDKMDYYFKSDFLKKQSWAEQKTDGLTPLISNAHKNGLKVMINIEGVNPYHWEQHKWTPETIAATANDLADSKVDAVFEECFEVSPDVFLSLARTLKKRGVHYMSGTDPMLLREPSFVKLWPETGIINIYNYYLKRDKLYSVATLTQHGSLGLGWAKYWKMPTSLMTPVNRDWGIDNKVTPAVVSYMSMIRALQFKIDNIVIFGGYPAFDPVKNKKWLQDYVSKQESRPLMNLVVLPGDEGNERFWNRLFNSGDAISSGAFHGGYDLIVSDKPVAADAYYIYTSGKGSSSVSDEVVRLYDTDKKIFLQFSGEVPNGESISPVWKRVLDKCGVDATIKFRYAAGTDNPSNISLPEDQSGEIPYTGYFKDIYLRFPGADVQRGRELRAGTIIPKNAIKGEVFSDPNRTYGRGPYLLGQNGKYLITATSLNWEASYPISNLLSGGGLLPSSNAWGIVGKNVTGLLAIETTEINLTIPGMADGTKVKVSVWDRNGNEKTKKTIQYKAPFQEILKEYDFLMIEKL